MIQVIKLFLLKRKIGYRKSVFEKGCYYCLAFIGDHPYRKATGYCNRYKLFIETMHTCDHFVPRKPLSKKERTELEKTKNYLWDTFKGMIDNFGVRK
jgi:hypothetical protein